MIPVNLIEPASPAIVGILRHSDGTPAARARIAVSSEYEDLNCAKASARVTANASGAFGLNPTIRRVRWLMIIPPFERFFSSYTLCAGSTDTTLLQAYKGLAYLRTRSAQPADTVRCIEWMWEQQPRIACTGEFDREAIKAGGGWTDGTASGFYRLIIARYERPRIERRVLWRGVVTDPERVFLQWVQRDSDGSREIVRDIVPLPLAAKFLSLEEAQFRFEQSKPVRVVVRSVGEPKSKWKSLGPTRECSLFDLGPPGELRQHPCPD